MVLLNLHQQDEDHEAPLACKQTSRSYQTFRRPNSDLKRKPMTGRMPGLGLQIKLAGQT
ncbi:hypothetical protein MTR_8g093590 [Medicago truncatula]|uniref:Uncharacterized protein n=1 Tax=Medicago truncatula TaxID=3880 RepID=G7LE15_MEDTR|nr:hypothetical protein MTR_8g093590 [Medicago truncatula]